MYLAPRGGRDPGGVQRDRGRGRQCPAGAAGAHEHVEAPARRHRHGPGRGVLRRRCCRARSPRRAGPRRRATGVRRPPRRVRRLRPSTRWRCRARAVPAPAPRESAARAARRRRGHDRRNRSAPCRRCRGTRTRAAAATARPVNRAPPAWPPAMVSPSTVSAAGARTSSRTSPAVVIGRMPRTAGLSPRRRARRWRAPTRTARWSAARSRARRCPTGP